MNYRDGRVHRNKNQVSMHLKKRHRGHIIVQCGPARIHLNFYPKVLVASNRWGPQLRVHSFGWRRWRWTGARHAAL